MASPPDAAFIADAIRRFGSAEKRRLHWLRETGLLPPDERSGVPVRPSVPLIPPGKPEPRLFLFDDEYRHRRWAISHHYWGDAGPAWENVVRVLEEGR